MQDTGTTQGLQEMLRLVNLGDPAIVMQNTANSNEWTIRAGARLIMQNNNAGGTFLFDLDNAGNLEIAGTLTQNSDRNSKKDIVAVRQDEVLDRLEQLPISLWTRKDDTGGQHMGPMAQDFYRLFGLGLTDTRIATLDMAGVALASIQALNRRLAEKDVQLEALRISNDHLSTRLRAVEGQLSR